jgi:hypothetical protein
VELKLKPKRQDRPGGIISHQRSEAEQRRYEGIKEPSLGLERPGIGI